MTAKKVINVDGTVFAMIGLVFAAFVAGLFVYGMYLIPAHVDRADVWCEGHGSGYADQYDHIQKIGADVFAGTVEKETGRVVPWEQVFHPLNPEAEVQNVQYCKDKGLSPYHAPTTTVAP